MGTTMHVPTPNTHPMTSTPTNRKNCFQKNTTQTKLNFEVLSIVEVNLVLYFETTVAGTPDPIQRSSDQYNILILL